MEGAARGRIRQKKKEKKEGGKNKQTTREKERKQNTRAFVAADLRVKTERFTICWLGTLRPFWYECDLQHSCTEPFCLSLRSSVQTIQGYFRRSTILDNILTFFYQKILIRRHFI